MPRLTPSTLSLRTRRSTWTVVHAQQLDVVIRRTPDNRNPRFYAYRHIAGLTWMQIPGHFYRLDQARVALASESASITVWELLTPLLDLAAKTQPLSTEPLPIAAGGDR
ncbi:hypothetical protein [Nonomuraea endophytica]|uniref:Uncharacterized protein n=1 Tax=Nonomuraea endophytica TaxID=714136 RepID=A0A7W8A805_9ACTN|nr:hypothetical protein [Nonomuraea endophytica]MBB5081316.1 hypothetical protein [Nonomuraea endophytica]